MRYWLFALFALIAGPASAQTLWPPDEVVIYVNADVRNSDFVEPLICALSKVLVAPVRAKKTDLPLAKDLLETARAFSPMKIARNFMRTVSGDSDYATPFLYFILDHDLTSSGLNYVFAETYTPPLLSVISVTRLAPGQARATGGPSAAEITANRVYKLMLKSVAIMAGLKSSGCVMMFPRSLEELDLKSSEYCPDDHAALVAARVIKEQPSATCADVVASR